MKWDYNQREGQDHDQNVCDNFKILNFSTFLKQWHNSDYFFELHWNSIHLEFTQWNNPSNLIWHFKWLFMGYIDICSSAETVTQGTENCLLKKLWWQKLLT